MAVKEKEEVNTSDERAKALKLAIDKIEKDFGKGAIMKLGDKPAVSVETIPTGALALDSARCRRYSARAYYRNLRA